jgi:hypothetical protein
VIRVCALIALVGCGSPKVTPPRPVPVAIDEDRAACDRLCAREKACGADTKDCAASCAADVARMKEGFVATYVRCYLKDLDQKCGAFDDKAREQTHLACFDVALAGSPRDEKNQRDMAEAVCDRGDRCLGLGKLGRDACLQATLDPHEEEVRLGQRLVDALRRERVVKFRTCVDKSPCPKLGDHDDVVDHCYSTTIAGGA